MLPKLWSKIGGAQNNAPRIAAKDQGSRLCLLSKAGFQGFGFQGQVLGFWVSRLGFRSFGFQGLGLGLWVPRLVWTFGGFKAGVYQGLGIGGKRV